MAQKSMYQIINEVTECSVRAYNKVCCGYGDDCQNLILRSIGSGSPSSNPPFQLAEPFNGNLETARVLFVGLNPGVTREEYFPTLNARYPLIPPYDFYINRFSNNDYTFLYKTKSGVRHFYTRVNYVSPGMENTGELDPEIPGAVKYRFAGETDYIELHGKYYKKIGGGSYWATIDKIAELIFRKIDPNKEVVKAGEDYALTEIVMCKSVDTSGNILSDSIDKCFSYFIDVCESTTNCEWIVILGADSGAAFYNKLLLPYFTDLSGKHLPNLPTPGSVYTSSTGAYPIYELPPNKNNKIVKVLFTPHSGVGKNKVTSALANPYTVLKKV